MGETIREFVGEGHYETANFEHSAPIGGYKPERFTEVIFIFSCPSVNFLAVHHSVHTVGLHPVVPLHQFDDWIFSVSGSQYRDRDCRGLDICNRRKLSPTIH